MSYLNPDPPPSVRFAWLMLLLWSACVVGFVMFAPPVAALEATYADRWCAAQGGKREVVLADRARVDCLTDKHAVEVDYAPKWAEAIGQSLYYSAMTGRRAGIVLIVAPEDGAAVNRLRTSIRAQCLPIEVWEVPK